MTTYYRYEDVRYAPPLDEWDRPCGSGTTEIVLREYPVVRETPKGVWLDVYGSRRFVLHSARRRFACATKELALESFVARKQVQLSILCGQASKVEYALNLAKRLGANVSEEEFA